MSAEGFDERQHGLGWQRRWELARGELTALTDSMRRGRLVSATVLPLPLRRTLLRAGGVRIGPGVAGLRRCRIDNPHVTIARDVYVNTGLQVEGRAPVTIGAGVMIGPDVLILTSTHDQLADGTFGPTIYRRVTIGERCWLGARSVVLPGVTIGDGVIIAAGAVVASDCREPGTYAGVPAKKVR
jgi:acetyltransferase-like isoleucine patch superfamily enzyme